MTPEERQAIKDEIKAEMLAVINANKNKSFWDPIRKSAESRIAVGGKLEYQITTAIGTIVKTKFGLKNIRALDHSQIIEAKNIVDVILKILGY